MAKDEKTNDMLATAFQVAESLNFKLFFSFDYAGNGAWDKATVISFIEAWKASSAYYKRPGGLQPLVSAFEGSGVAADWIEIKAKTSCFFVPDYSSLVGRRFGSLCCAAFGNLFLCPYFC